MTEQELARWVWELQLALPEEIEDALPRSVRCPWCDTDDQIRALYAKHCECRPLDVERTSHSHDCDDAILEHCRVALGGRPDGTIYPRSTVTAFIQRQAAREICEAILRERQPSEGKDDV